jgi:hypothetical protein
VLHVHYIIIFISVLCASIWSSSVQAVVQNVIPVNFGRDLKGLNLCFKGTSNIHRQNIQDTVNNILTKWLSIFSCLETEWDDWTVESKALFCVAWTSYYTETNEISEQNSITFTVSPCCLQIGFPSSLPLAPLLEPPHMQGSIRTQLPIHVSSHHSYNAALLSVNVILQ